MRQAQSTTERPLDRPISWLAPGAVQPSLRAEGAGKILTDGSGSIQVPLHCYPGAAPIIACSFLELVLDC